MKRIALLVMLIALWAIGASAVQVTNPTLGGEKQDRIKNVITTFRITNNESSTLTGITISAGAGASDPKYALTFSGIPANITAGSTADITVNGTIPLDHPGVDADLKVAAIKIGTFTVSGTAGSSVSVTGDLYMQAVNQLRIKKSRIECDTKSQSVDDGDRVKNLKPGMSCSLEVEVENQFDDNDNNNQKIGDISFDTVDIKLDSSDGDVDVDEDDDIDGLDAGDEDSVTADLEIDEEADDGTITIDVRVSGKDDNGALHGEQLDFRLEIERLSHDIQLRRIELIPSAIENCEAANSRVSINVLNQGKRDEDEVSLEVVSTDLKFSKRIDNIELDKDDSTSANFDVPVAKDFKPGVYRLDVKSYFDTSAPSNSGSVELTVSGCGSEEVETPVVTETPKTTTTTVVTPQATVTTSGQAQAAPKKTTSFTDSKAYVALLAVVSILIAGAIVALVIMMTRKKRD